MKKLLYLIFVSSMLILNINAADLTDYCKDAPPGTKESCTNTITFCYGDKEYVGCPFDQTKKYMPLLQLIMLELKELAFMVQCLGHLV